MDFSKSVVACTTLSTSVSDYNLPTKKIKVREKENTLPKNKRKKSSRNKEKKKKSDKDYPTNKRKQSKQYQTKKDNSSLKNQLT